MTIVVSYYIIDQIYVILIFLKIYIRTIASISNLLYGKMNKIIKSPLLSQWLELLRYDLSRLRYPYLPTWYTLSYVIPLMLLWTQVECDWGVLNIHISIIELLRL